MEVLMPSLQVRDLPDHLYRKLVEAAKREHRSLAQQAAATIARGLGLELDPASRRQELLRALRDRPRVEVPADLPDPVALVREDRCR
jgi:plasmid stability protein